MFTYRNDALKTLGGWTNDNTCFKKRKKEKKKKDKSETKNDRGKHAKQKIAEGLRENHISVMHV